MNEHSAKTHAIDIPLGYPCSTFFVDESGSRASAGRFFVTAAIKTRRPGQLVREIAHIRDRHQNFDELKFTKVSEGRLPIFFDLVELLGESDARISAAVIDGDRSEAVYRSNEPTWKNHARVAAQLLCGSMNRRELTAAVIDEVSTPREIAYDDVVRGMVNRRLGSIALVSAVCADSRCTDALQLADLIAGAIAHARRQPHATRSHKSRVARRVCDVFGLDDLSRDQRTDRVNSVTLHGLGGPTR